jgi:hypothetical protein
VSAYRLRGGRAEPIGDANRAVLIVHGQYVGLAVGSASEDAARELMLMDADEAATLGRSLVEASEAARSKESPP